MDRKHVPLLLEDPFECIAQDVGYGLQHEQQAGVDIYHALPLHSQD